VIIYNTVQNEDHIALKDYRGFNVAISRARVKAVVLSPLGGNADNLPWMLTYRKTTLKVDVDTLRVPREVRQAICAVKSRSEKGLDGFDLFSFILLVEAPQPIQRIIWRTQHQCLTSKTTSRRRQYNVFTSYVVVYKSVILNKNLAQPIPHFCPVFKKPRILQAPFFPNFIPCYPNKLN
jgi:hypothetical protein